MCEAVIVWTYIHTYLLLSSFSACSTVSEYQKCIQISQAGCSITSTCRMNKDFNEIEVCYKKSIDICSKYRE